MGNQTALDGVYNLMPELQNLVQGSMININRYANLSFLIQTGFYTHPGTFKYKVKFSLKIECSELYKW